MHAWHYITFGESAMADADFEKYDFDENLFQSPSRHHLDKMVRILFRRWWSEHECISWLYRQWIVCETRVIEIYNSCGHELSHLCFFFILYLSAWNSYNELLNCACVEKLMNQILLLPPFLNIWRHWLFFLRLIIRLFYKYLCK